MSMHTLTVAICLFASVASVSSLIQRQYLPAGISFACAMFLLPSMLQFDMFTARLVLGGLMVVLGGLELIILITGKDRLVETLAATFIAFVAILFGSAIFAHNPATAATQRTCKDSLTLTMKQVGNETKISYTCGNSKIVHKL